MRLFSELVSPTGQLAFAASLTTCAPADRAARSTLRSIFCGSSCMNLPSSASPLMCIVFFNVVSVISARFLFAKEFDGLAVANHRWPADDLPCRRVRSHDDEAAGCVNVCAVAEPHARADARQSNHVQQTLVAAW